MIWDKVRKIREEKKPQNIVFAVLLAVGVLWLIYAVHLFLIPNAEYIFSGQELQTDYGIYMENFLEGYGGVY